MFDRMKYMNYIETLENQIKVVYAVILVIAVLIGIATAFIGLIITVPLGLLCAKWYTVAQKIKIEEMKWQIDIHRIINPKEIA